MSDDLLPDALDDELRLRFTRGAPAGSDPDVVLDALRPQLQRARTRRRASFASAIAGVAVVVVVLAFALGGGGGGSSSVHTPPASRGPINTVPPTPTTAGVGGSATPDTVPDDHGNDDPAPATSPTTPEAPGATEVPATAPPTVPGTEDRVFSSPGGSIVVHFGGGAVSFAGSTAADGYATEVHDNGPTRVEVRFNNGQTEWRIRVDVVNGQLVSEVTQH